jgi:hypothetical protein
MQGSLCPGLVINSRQRGSAGLAERSGGVISPEVVTVSLGGERRARVALSFVANPGDPVLGAVLRTMSASAVLAAVTGSDEDGQALLADHEPDAALARAIERWRARIPELPGTGTLAGR